MATYIAGDIQGCLTPLKCLLDTVKFDSNNDQLWSVGDIVNRGPNSLETLRFLKSLKKSFRMVLGNHDLHLIAMYYGIRAVKRQDTLQTILDAPDCKELIDWLRHQPLIFKQDNNVVIHAGIPHFWSVSQAMQFAKEVEALLHSQDPTPFLENMYGDQPDNWSEQLAGADRLRTITNYLTRMRVCKEDGTLNLDYKGGLDDIPKKYASWFSYPRENNLETTNIFFGHWAALEARTYREYFHALDSGCVWGETLTLYRLEDNKRFTCDCDA